MLPGRARRSGRRRSSRRCASGVSAGPLRGDRACSEACVQASSRPWRRRVRRVSNADIGGWVETSFEPVLDAFAANFDERDDVGGAVCVYVDGEPVVDLWGGLADKTTGRPWTAD